MISKRAYPPTSTLSSLFGRIAKGSGALSAGAVVNVIGHLSLVPAAMYGWGETRYGEWLILAGLVSFVKLSDLGLQSYVVNRLTASYALQDRNEIQRVLHSALRVHLALVGVLVLAFGGLFYLLPLQQLLNLETIGGLELAVVALLLTLELLIGVPMGVVAGLYRATGRLPRGAFVGAAQHFSVFAISVALIIGGASFLTVAAARVGVSLAVSGWILRDLRRLYPWLRLKPEYGSWRFGVAMIGPGIFFLLVPVADYLSNQFTLIVVQNYLSGADVSRLATHRTAVNLARMVGGLLTAAAWPEFTALSARNQWGALRTTHRSLARFEVWLVGAIALGLLPFLPFIYPAWTINRLALEPWTLAFLTIRVVAWGFWAISMTCLLATNRQRIVALALLGAAVITGVLSVLLVPVMGISGAALAGLLGDGCLVAWYLPLRASRAIDDRFLAHLRRSLLGPLTALAAGAGLAIVGWYLFRQPLPRYLLALPTAAAFALVLAWQQLDARERQFALRLLKNVRERIPFTRPRERGRDVEQ